MSVLLRAAELIKRPVVTLAGDDVAQIKDVIYSSVTGELAGFTLNGRGIFAGPMRKTLPWENVHGLGPAAVMIRDESSLGDKKALRGQTEGAGGAVLGSTVITQSGRNLGTVTDVILAVGPTMTDAVGYEISPSDDSAPRRQFVPLPDALAVSGEALMLPDAAIEFIRDDLAGFGAAVEEFRSRLSKGHDSQLEDDRTSGDDVQKPLEDVKKPGIDVQNQKDDVPTRTEDVPTRTEDVQTRADDVQKPKDDVPTRADDAAKPPTETATTAKLPIEDAE
jgi:uncharacterized protein YrrD